MIIKFLQLNIWDKEMLLDEIIAYIKKEQFDILNLQEVYDSEDQSIPRKYRTVDILKQELSYKYYFYSAEYLDNTSYGKINEGNLIISHYPIQTSTVKFYDKQYEEANLDLLRKQPNADFSHLPRNLQNAEIIIYNKTFHVYNTHGTWGFDGEDNEKRLHMSKVIVAKVKDKENVILSGDFNTYPTTRTVMNIEKHLVNIFKNSIKTTFNIKRKPDEGSWGSSIVDYVFVSPDIKVVNHYQPQVDISDHLPLVVEFEI